MTVRAIYKDGQLHIQESVDLQEGKDVEILIMPGLDDAFDIAVTGNDEKKPRIPGPHEGAWQVSDEFDDPLPDELLT